MRIVVAVVMDGVRRLLDSEWTTEHRRDELRNVHERRMPSSVAASRELLATVATPDDLVWPTSRWPRIWFGEAGLELGARGGHGPVRYEVVDRSDDALEFAFTGQLRGSHRLAMEEVEGGVLWSHTLHFLQPTPKETLVLLPLHDALLEDLLDRVFAQLAGRGWVPRPFPLRVRLLRAALRR